MNKFRSFFESRARQNDDYEMVLRFDVDSTNDSDDLDNQPPIDIRERRLQLLRNKSKIVLLWVVYFTYSGYIDICAIFQ